VRRALFALGALLVAVAIGLTGVAAATPVPVLRMSDGQRAYVTYFPDQDQLLYSYRQSIYGVTVYEQFFRANDSLELRRVSARDIRAVEYFRWDTPIQQQHDTYETVPPLTVVNELTIRVTREGQQIMRTSGTSTSLLERFGETVVRVRPQRPSLLAALLDGLTW
jgi:hypothetical protein